MKKASKILSFVGIALLTACGQNNKSTEKSSLYATQETRHFVCSDSDQISLVGDVSSNLVLTKTILNFNGGDHEFDNEVDKESPTAINANSVVYVMAGLTDMGSGRTKFIFPKNFQKPGKYSMEVKDKPDGVNEFESATLKCETK